jgi:hypothetical protein
MSLLILTPDALRSESNTYSGVGWRLVEAQHKISTMKLVDTTDEQALLEEILEAAKPAYPDGCESLDFLLKTPFRYSALYPSGSRFRRAGRSPGVFYCAEQPRTAVAEMIFYRLLFFAESPKTPWPSNPAEYSAFSVGLATQSHLNLTRPPLSGHSKSWTDLLNYAACQHLADQAREIGAQIIRYASVRDPEGGANLAVLDPNCFSSPRPLSQQTWKVRLGPGGVQALCEMPRVRLNFSKQDFSPDPRIAAMVWARSAGA